MPAKMQAKADVNTMKSAEDAVRDLKNWVFVFAKEYDLPKDAIDKLHEQVDRVALKIGQIQCR